MNRRQTDREVRGFCDEAFTPVSDALQAFASDHEFHAQLSIYHRGHEVVDLCIGEVQADSLTGVFSASKGVGGLVMGLLVERGLLNVNLPVSYYWPEFGQADKDDIRVGDLLSHRAGLVGVPGGLTWDELLDSRRAAERLAQQRPAWTPGLFHGYHAFTIGVFADELCRRITNRSLQAFYEEEVGAPFDIDFHIGLPETEDSRYLPVRPASSPAPLPAALLDDLGSFAFNNNPTLTDTDGELLPNNAELRRAGNTSVGGVATARGLAKLYACTLGGGTLPKLFSDATIECVGQLRSAGLDVVLGCEKRFGLMFLKPEPSAPFGSHAAFGHDGAGGTLGFADPVYDLAFGYNVWPMVSPGGADPRAVALSQVARRCVRRLTT